MNRQEKLEMRLREMSKLENSLWNEGYTMVAGVDEVGRGCLAGPVVACAIVLPKGWNITGLDDSKKLSEKRRLEMYHIIKEKALAISIGMVDNESIDKVNILEATKKAMTEAILELDEKLVASHKKGVDMILIDAMQLPKINKLQKSIIKGDSKSISIAAASIVAKVTRDKLMEEMDEKYPGYAFGKNKGYGTKEHYLGLDNIGVSPIHRKSFLKKYFEKSKCIISIM